MNNQAYDDTATRNPRKAYTDYENSTYTVVSKVAYLIGVQKRIFENEYEPPKMEWYEKLHADKNARIVRNLCMIRTALELNFKAINNRMRFDMCNLHSLPEYVPQDSLNELLQDDRPPILIFTIIISTTSESVNRADIYFDTLISRRV